MMKSLNIIGKILDDLKLLGNIIQTFIAFTTDID